MPSDPAAPSSQVLAFIGNIGTGELLVILIVALIVVGPQRLPDAAKSIGKAMGELRRASTGFQNELRSAIDDTTDVDADTKRTARKNVLQKEEPAVPADGDATADAAAAVSRQAGATRRPRRTRPLEADPDPGDAGDSEEQ
jgi:Tat protein translocase TatB subunit